MAHSKNGFGWLDRLDEWRERARQKCDNRTQHRAKHWKNYFHRRKFVESLRECLKDSFAFHRSVCEKLLMIIGTCENYKFLPSSEKKERTHVRWSFDYGFSGLRWKSCTIEKGIHFFSALNFLVNWKIGQSICWWKVSHVWMCTLEEDIVEVVHRLQRVSWVY